MTLPGKILVLTPRSAISGYFESLGQDFRETVETALDPRPDSNIRDIRTTFTRTANCKN